MTGVGWGQPWAPGLVGSVSRAPPCSGLLVCPPLPSAHPEVQPPWRPAELGRLLSPNPAQTCQGKAAARVGVAAGGLRVQRLSPGAALRRLAGGESAAGPEAPLSSRPRGAIGGPGRASPPLPFPQGGCLERKLTGAGGCGARPQVPRLSSVLFGPVLESCQRPGAALGPRWRVSPARGSYREGVQSVGVRQGKPGPATSPASSPGAGVISPHPAPFVPAPPAPASILPSGLRPPRLEGVGVGPPSATLGKSPKVSGEKKVGPPKDRWRGQLRGVDRLLPAGLVLPACAPDTGSPPASRLRSPRAGPTLPPSLRF